MTVSAIVNQRCVYKTKRSFRHFLTANQFEILQEIMIQSGAAPRELLELQGKGCTPPTSQRGNNAFHCALLFVDSCCVHCSIKSDCSKNDGGTKDQLLPDLFIKTTIVCVCCPQNSVSCNVEPYSPPVTVGVAKSTKS